jgi:hypothetical protein
MSFAIPVGTPTCGRPRVLIAASRYVEKSPNTIGETGTDRETLRKSRHSLPDPSGRVVVHKNDARSRYRSQSEVD